MVYTSLLVTPAQESCENSSTCLLKHVDNNLIHIYEKHWELTLQCHLRRLLENVVCGTFTTAEKHLEVFTLQHLQ